MTTSAAPGTRPAAPSKIADLLAEFEPGERAPRAELENYEGVLVTVAIPTFNGRAYIEEVLESIFSQRAEFSYEVLVIDSGSTDGTLEVLRKFPIRLIEIPNSEFGHGKTRNYAVSISEGDYVAFLTQDATPAHSEWLGFYMDAFLLDEKVACVYGPHLPRPDADPKTARDHLEFFRGMGPCDGPTIQNDAPTFFSDVNGCISKKVWQSIPYLELDYAEDQAFGRDILEAGYLKVYEPRAAAVHSHFYPPVAHFKRLFDEWRGLRNSLGIVESLPLVRVIGGSLKGTWRDSRLIMLEKELSFARRLRWAARSAHLNLSRRLAPYLVAREDRLPKRLNEWLSYERSWKKRAA